MLRNQRARIFTLNEEAFGLMGQFRVSRRVMEKLREMPLGKQWSEAEFSQQLEDRIPDLGVTARGQIVEAAVIAAYHAETGYPVVRLLVCDDAKQFKLVTDELAL